MPRPAPTLRDFASGPLTSIGPERSVRSASDQMQEAGIRHLPVLHDDKVVGIITWDDIAVLETVLAVDDDAMMVGEVMTRDVATMPIDAPLREAAALMSARAIGSVVVTDGDAVHGVFTATDAVRALAELVVAWPDDGS